MKFSIRDVLWLMVVAALGLAWWADHRRQAQVEQKFKVVDQLLQHMVNLYYADTGRHLVLDEDLTDLHYRPINVKTAASP
jgi:hypothetical protein